MKAEEIREMFNFTTPGYEPGVAYVRERAQIAALGEIAAQLADSNELQREEIARRGTADKNVKLERERKNLSCSLIFRQRQKLPGQARIICCRRSLRTIPSCSRMAGVGRVKHAPHF